jgi:serine/threonine-protein kinase
MLEADEETDDLLDHGVESIAQIAATLPENDALHPGDIVGDFEIVSEIGRGGMGVVYAARDRKLGRIAALKLLPSSARLDASASDRLIEEAQAASALDHPNVATIYQIGETTDGHRFIAMARYEGETLRDRLRRGPVPPREAFRIAAQIASGLSAAHAAGLVHRDVKPENIFITRSGLAKLLDFGIATLAGSARDGPSTRGTVLYMSPEQARRETAGPSSDVWSLGVVLYEMLSGATPFTGSTPEEVLDKIRSPSPVQLSPAARELPRAASLILAKALEKASAKRYSDAGQMAPALELALNTSSRSRRVQFAIAALTVTVIGVALFARSRSASTVDTGIPEVAVLPVTGVAADSESVQLADALSNEIAARVAGVGRVRLVSAPKRIVPDANSRLHFLRFTLERGGSQPVVHITLDRGLETKPQWQIRREFDKKELRELGRDVVVGVLEALHQPMNDRERAAIGNAFPSSAEAYEEFLQANRLLIIRTPASVESAVQHYRRAAELDTTFASAFARQSYAYSLLADWGWKPTNAFPGDPLIEARRLADRATALDSISADAWLARAYTLVLKDPFRMQGAPEAFQRAITLDPYNAEAFHQYGQALMALGRYAEALAAYRRVIDLEPDRAMTFVPMAAIVERQGDLKSGLRMLDSAISAAPRVPSARATRSLFRAQSGDTRGAIADAEFALSLDPHYPIPALSALSKALWIAGRRTESIARLEQAERAVANPESLSYTEAYWIGLAEAEAGRLAKAVELLRKSQPHGAYLWFLLQSSTFDKLRAVPEFSAMLSRMDPRRPADDDRD